MTDLLIIDDDKSLSQLLKEYLTGQGYTVRLAENGKAGLRSMYEHQPGTVILDVSMPEQDGWETLKRIREISSLPVIMLTARGDEADILHGFSLGADDYVTKPFGVRELLARIRVCLRRQPSQTQMPQYRFGKVEIDFEKYRVTLGKKAVELTQKEFELMRFFIQNRETVLSMLGRAAFGTGFLYVRRERLDEVRPMQVGAGSFVKPVDLAHIRLMPSAQRYEWVIVPPMSSQVR